MGNFDMIYSMQRKIREEKAEIDTFVFIDASNIRSSCLKTLGFKVDFYKLLDYFRKKYPKFRKAYYYEGKAKDDIKKQEEFDNLTVAGYEVRFLERKSYFQPPVYKDVKCKNCKTVRRVQVLKRSLSLKSNVDVYLATDLVKIAYLAKKPTRIILVACDGDYAEMIKAALETNKNIHISVVATPVVPLIKLSGKRFRNDNSCSTRLQKLRGKLHNFTMLNIGDIQDLIKQK